MKKKIFIMTVFLVIISTSLVFAYPAADFNNTYSNINIGSIGSTTYNVPWNARTTATEPAAWISVNSTIYFNDVAKGSSFKKNYNNSTVYDNGTVIGNVGPKGTWKISAIHEFPTFAYDDYGNTWPITVGWRTYDSVYYDPGI